MSAFLSILLLFSSFPVKANEVNEVTFPSFPLPVEGYSSTHYIIYYDVTYDKYILIKPLDHNSIIVEKRSDSDILKFLGPYISYQWAEGDNSWEWYSSGTGGSQRTLYHDNVIMLYSSLDLYYEDGSIFFQQAPIKETFLGQMKKIQMGATMTTVVSLIPLLIALLVSLIAFRKAWAWLLKVLRTA